MRPPESIIPEKIAMHILLWRSLPPSAHLYRCDWAGMAGELSGPLQQHSGNLGSAGGIILVRGVIASGSRTSGVEPQMQRRENELH